MIFFFNTCFHIVGIYLLFEIRNILVGAHKYFYCLNNNLPIQIHIQRLGIFHFLLLVVAGRYNALLSNGHLRDCPLCNCTYRKTLVSK
jgi:hypothetical protein